MFTMSEQDIATMEAYRHECAERYFSARPGLLEIEQSRKLFDAGFDRAWMTLNELRGK